MNQHPEPLLPSIALYYSPSGGHSAAGSGPEPAPDPGQARPGGLLSTAGAFYYQLYWLKKAHQLPRRAADGPVKVQCPLAGSNRRPEH